MGKNMLTTKEATLISDLLTMEESACKKARLYSRILTDPELAESFGKIADNHEKRFNALLELL
ncbi:MAG: spore coat protein [Clostridiales bacterium]|nr:spore coat protein [Clostridiales bacterium]